MARQHVMSSQKSKKKVAAVTAGVLATALTVGGAFAWRDFSQSFTNVFRGGSAADVLLHDDFQPWEHKDVYVENPGEQAVIARVRFDEFLQIGNDVHVPAATDLLAGEEPSYDTKELYKTYLWDEATVNGELVLADGTTLSAGSYASGNDPISDYVAWTLGGNKIYLQGTSELGYVDYEDKTPGVFTTEGVFDGTGADVGENGQYFAKTGELNDGSGTVISTAPVLMSTLCTDDGTDATWTDTDVATTMAGVTGWILDDSADGNGWAYWATGLESNQATSKLLDNAYKIKNPEDNWNYNINVVMHATNYTEYRDLISMETTAQPDTREYVENEKNKASICAAELIEYIATNP